MHGPGRVDHGGGARPARSLALGPRGVGRLRRHAASRPRHLSQRAPDRGGPVHLSPVPALFPAGGPRRGAARPSRVADPGPRPRALPAVIPYRSADRHVA